LAEILGDGMRRVTFLKKSLACLGVYHYAFRPFSRSLGFAPNALAAPVPNVPAASTTTGEARRSQEEGMKTRALMKAIRIFAVKEKKNANAKKIACAASETS
jgi:hypothetical protein